MSLSQSPGGFPGALTGTRTGKAELVEFVFFTQDMDALFARMDRSIAGPALAVFLQTQGQEFFHHDIEDRFNEEGDPKVGFWAPLKDATISIRESLGFGDGPINRRTDEMFDALMGDYPVSMGPAYAEMKVPGPVSDLAARKIETAQHGAAFNPVGWFGPTPPRPVLAVSEMDAQALMELYQVFFVAEMMSEAGV